ncbi:MAG: glycosyltransferase family 2 protein, partial [Gammaproteobacteria bacterium]|nr:glycosyltransferase family 2 protein [Gammaproteobacteria bacterium]
MPIYNEARFLADAFDSLLAQDYPNFRIHVSDNASNDGSESIAREYAGRDARVCYERLPRNLGAAENFRRVAAQANGDYFMWAAGHDRWSANLLSQCVAALEARPAAVIAFASCRWIDGDGNALERESGHTDTRGMGAIERFFAVYWGNMHPVLGVLRRSSLARAREVQATAGADLVLLTELALMGDFVHVSDALWSRRDFRVERDYADKLRRYRSREYALVRSPLARLFPLAALPLALARNVLRARLHLVDKLCLLALLAPSLPIRYLA